MRILIVGCGYLGSELAQVAQQNGCTVYATCRSDSRRRELDQLGYHPIEYDWLKTADIGPLPEVDRVVVCVSHAKVPELLPEQSHPRGLANLRSRVNERCQKWVYLSTTGVMAGSIDARQVVDVDEGSPTFPVRPGAVCALAGERWFFEHLSTDRFTVIRPAGIYGPGRTPNLERLRQGLPLEVDPNSYLNLIHVVDLARIVYWAATNPTDHSLYCVSDGHSVLRRDYYEFIRLRFGLPEPQYVAADAASGDGLPLRRGQDHKRVSNRRILAEYPHSWIYPSFREGLADSLVDKHL